MVAITIVFSYSLAGGRGNSESISMQCAVWLEVGERSSHTHGSNVEGMFLEGSRAPLAPVSRRHTTICLQMLSA
jgi:hypothetical protein